MNELIVATRNSGKAKEFNDFLAPYRIKAISLHELSQEIDEIEETGVTFSANAALKAEQIAEMMKRPVLADDSGLVIDHLDGRPGVFSARYAGEPKDDQANIEKVLNELDGVYSPQRTARFVCVLAVAVPGEATQFKTGYCNGRIAFTQTGQHGFGYDPIFIPDGYSKTMAQLTPEDKNKISHRKNAISQLDEWARNISYKMR